MLLPPGANQELEMPDDVWLRKRLVESLPCEIIPEKNRFFEIVSAMQDRSDVEVSSWAYILHNIPWNRQVGPSCGLAALRMLHAAANGPDKVASPIDNIQVEGASLLQYAIHNGMTVDGEIFDATQLLALCQATGRLQCRIQSFRETNAKIMIDQLLKNQLVIFAYDSQPMTRQPCKNGGRTAHYGVVVGVLLESPQDCFRKSLTIDKLKEHKPRDLKMIGTLASAEEALTACSKIYLLLQHGLSNKLLIGPWEEFFESNQQLQYVDEKKYPGSPPMNLADHLLVVQLPH